MDNKEVMIEEAKILVDLFLNEAEQNVIPEVPDDGKTAGKDVKKEIEGKSDGDSKSVKVDTKAVDEHVDNVMPEVPDESKTAGKDIKKAIVDPTNPKLEKLPTVQQPKIDNELPDGTTPDPVGTSVNKMKDDIAESILARLQSKKKV